MVVDLRKKETFKDKLYKNFLLIYTIIFAIILLLLIVGVIMLFNPVTYGYLSYCTFFGVL
ncbi:hypothetical protein [Methanobrevibacter sp. UBA417]|jgi:thiosulfate reductase cytochrome b subunit|uniref:hypothetical protein n=1 Tax=Methanobrevibacter sp. UBA417 TaxID=1915487 RepID=UPI0039B8A88D